MNSEKPSAKPWFMYVVRCADGTLYTGITTDLARRVKIHNAGQGAQYTKTRRPVTLVAAWRFGDGGRPRAMKAERRFKKLPRARKLTVVASADDWEGGARVDDSEDIRPPGL